VAVETFDFNENRPRICEPKCIQKAEKIVYRHPDATRFLPNSGLLGITLSTEVTQYLFRLSADKATGHFFERQLLMDLPDHLIHRLPKTTIERIVAGASQYLSR
jgi:hypothetical protein